MHCSVNAPAGLLDRPVDVEARNTRPRFSGPDHCPNRHARRAQARRCKAGSTTTRGACGKSGLFLNNRHYDPATGVFVSVDPLVTMTGQPYIYGAANPATNSDPTGLCTHFFMDDAGNYVCEFYPTDGPRVAVDNGPEERCNVGAVICTVDQGRIPYDFVFQRDDGSRPRGQPEEYDGVPTGLLDFEASRDPFDALGDEVWEHRRGILQAAGPLVGGACIFLSGGTFTPACVAAGYGIAGANIAQSAQDNLYTDGGCAGDFAIDVFFNTFTAGAGRMAADATDEFVALAGDLVQSGALISTTATGAIDYCAGP